MENQVLIDRVFSNSLIVQNILSHNVDDLVGSYFSRRLVNKSFNDAWLVVIRKEFREMEMEFNEIKASSPSSTGAWIETIHFNRRKIKKCQISSFLNFLKNAAGVSVKEFRVRNGWMPEPYLRKKWHGEIHSLLVENPKKLIGLEDMCNGCTACLEMAKSTREYGPFSIESSMKLEGTEHPRSLIITDRFLEQLANRSASSMISRNGCVGKLDSLINPRISCGTLVFWINETRTTYGRGDTRNHYHFPVEVLKMIIKKWRVKSIRIVFQFGIAGDFVVDKWSRVYTKFKFTDSQFENSFRIEMEHIELDMSESMFCHLEFSNFNPEKFEPKGYENLIVNTRKLFVTNSISITKFFSSESKLDTHQKVFGNILKMILKEKQPNVTINMQFFIVIPDFDLLNSTPSQPLEIPKEYVLPARASEVLCTYCATVRACCNLYYFPTRKWIGKRFKIEDKEEGFQFNLDAFLPQTILFHGWSEDQLNGNVKNFFDLFA